MTALLAVLALMFGAMTMAATATADPDPNKTPPGQSEGFVPPGQDDEFIPPGQDEDKPGMEKMTICHYVEGKSETKAGYNVITIAVSAWKAHLAHHPDTMDVVYDGVSCPTVTPQTDYCPADSTYPTTVLDGPYDAATDLATCYAPDVPTTPTTPTTVIPEEQAAAIDAAIAATEPEAVAPVLPATVAEDAEVPETVAVPAPATVAMPAAVPAGDGSTVPQVPIALLALLALATAAAVTSGLRMATNR